MANQKNVGAVLIIVFAAVGIYGCSGRHTATHSRPAIPDGTQAAVVELSRYGNVRTANGETTRLIAVRIDSTEYKITEETQRFQIAPGEHVLRLYYGAKQPPEGIELSLSYPQAELHFYAEAGQTYRVVGKTTGIGSSSWTSHEILDSTGRVVAKAPAPATSKPALSAQRLEELLAQLKDKDVRRQAQAAAEIGKYGPGTEAAVPSLIEVLKASRRNQGHGRPDESLRIAAMRSLAQIGQPAFPALKELLKDPNEQLRIDAVMILGRCAHVLGWMSREMIPGGIDPEIGPALPEALPLLLEAMKDKSDNVRWAAALAIANVRPSPVDSMLVIAAGLKNESARVRAQVARTLGAFGADASPAAEPLIGALGDKDTSVADAAAAALVSIGAKIDAQLIEALPRTMGVLVRIGRPVVPHVAELLRHKEPDTRRQAAMVLGRIGPEATITAPKVAGALKDEKDVHVAAQEAHALAKIATPLAAAAPALVAALKEQGQESHADEALDALKAMGPLAVGSLDDLLALFDYEDEYYRDFGSVDVRLRAMDVVGTMGPVAKDAVPALRKALKFKGPPGHETARRPVQWHAAEALAKIGPAAQVAIDDLLLVAKEKDTKDPDGYFYVRVTAIRSVVKLAPGDKRVVSALVDALKEKGLLKEAAFNLGEMGAAASDAIPALEERARQAKTSQEQKDIEQSIKKIRGLPAATQPVGALDGPATAPTTQPKATTIVMLRQVQPSDRPVELQDRVENWIVQEMKSLGHKGAEGTAKGWVELTDRPYTVHDSRHYGLAVVRMAKVTDTDITIMISGREGDKEVAVTLSNRPGSHKLIKHTISSSIASLDLYLAFGIAEPTAPATAPSVSDEASRRAKLLLADLDRFTLDFQYFPRRSGDAGEYPSLTLRTWNIKEDRPKHWPAVEIGKEQAKGIIALLAENGQLERMNTVMAPMARTLPPHYDGPTYVLSISSGGWRFDEKLVFNAQTYWRLLEFREILRGDTAKLIDKHMLDALADKYPTWKQAGEIAPAMLKELNLRLDYTGAAE